MVYGLCRGLLRDAVEAEDAAQQAFLSAFSALLRGSRPREPAAWLATIARNECLARIRSRMRAPLPAAELEPESAQRDPLALALARADLAAFWRAVSELPEQQRSALLLREFGGLSYEELGLALGVTTPAVESLLFRARTRLRGELKAAFAGANGAGWISALRELLPRLLAGGGATKAVAAAAGASVLAGGAVLGAHELVPQHRHASRAAAAATTAGRDAAPSGSSAGTAPVAAVAPDAAQGPHVRAHRSRPVAAAVFRAGPAATTLGRGEVAPREGPSGRDGGEHGGGRDGHDGGVTVGVAATVGSDGSSGGEATTTTSDSSSGDGRSGDGGSLDGGSGDASSTTGPGETTTSGSGDTGSSGDGGGGGGSDGSGSTTTTVASVTVTSPDG